MLLEMLGRVAFILLSYVFLETLVALEVTVVLHFQIHLLFRFNHIYFIFVFHISFVSAIILVVLV